MVHPAYARPGRGPLKGGRGAPGLACRVRLRCMCVLCPKLVVTLYTMTDRVHNVNTNHTTVIVLCKYAYSAYNVYVNILPTPIYQGYTNGTVYLLWGCVTLNVHN